jgi:tetratricopeptide (TPR) repeat protein
MGSRSASRLFVCSAVRMLHGFVFFALSAAALNGQEQRAPSEILKEAASLQRAGQLEQAIADYRLFLEKYPDVAPVRSDLGVALAGAGRYEEAIAEYKRALQLKPLPQVRLNLALAYYKTSKLSLAVTELQKVHEELPGDLRPLMLEADCHLRLGENKKVIELLTPVEQTNGDDLAIAYMLGTALVRDGKTEKGQVLVDKILKNGDSAEAHFLLGSQMFAAGDFPAAVKQFSAAIELNPSLPDLQSAYGRALLDTGDAEAASEAFRKELMSDLGSFDANFYLAQIHLAKREWSAAEPLVTRSLELRPDSLESKLALADLDIGEGKLQDARQVLLAAEKTWPKSVAVHQRLSHVYEELHLRTDAEREGGLAARLEPKHRSAGEGPRPGDPAPEFSSTPVGSGDLVSLSKLRNAGPVLLVFGSYTCPNFRSAAGTLNRLYGEYKSRVPFYLIYIREAHSTADWASTKNEREGIVVEPVTTTGQQKEHATMCVRKLHIEFPALLDSMNGDAEKAYSAWPSKAFLVDKRGRVIFDTALGEQDFNQEQLEAALRRVISPVKAANLPHKTQ